MLLELKLPLVAQNKMAVMMMMKIIYLMLKKIKVLLWFLKLFFR